MPPVRPPSGWWWTPLSTVARLESGHTPSRKHPEYWGGDIPWVGIRDATANHGQTIHDTQQRTNPLGIANSSARVLPTNTVCLSRTASVGYVVVMGRPMATSQDFINWVCTDAIDYRFLKYVFLVEHDSMLRFASGTTHQTIYFPEAKAFHICLPSIKTQRSIVEVLQSLDDRITLLRETNTTLEAIAQALFKSWFVDFDPVHAKQQGRAPEGMDEATAALFPDSFEESELGLVPQGWRVAPVGDVVESVGGGTPDTKEHAYWEPGEHCWTTPKDLSGIHAPVLLATERKLSAQGLAKVSSGLLPAGTLLMSSRAPIGYLAIAQAPLAINQGYIAMLPSSQLPPLYMLFWCQHNMEVIKGRANGSTFMEISKKAFRPIPALVPPEPVLDAYIGVAGALFGRLVENERQAQTLATLRDTLLPRLISGQLRLPEAEAPIEEIA
ncbi:restriction endonuclease subunit S [Ferribacterium limneticum]|uniref:restriction endonuclease subunit S n=1 Tax=Ferribacterium limneticum TaxID=76259 RepID=UPI001CFB8023|nr:restriction endonuclease subunit S [Ferribacterium limneticum]